MNIETITSTQITLFLLLAVGMFVRKKGYITDKNRKSFSDLLINIIMPCNIVNSFQGELTGSLLFHLAGAVLISFGVQFFGLFLSKVLYQGIETKKKQVLQYGTISSNSSFIGLPIVKELLPSEGMLYASVALVPFRIFMWSAGLGIFTGQKGDRKNQVRQTLLHPCMIAVYIGILVMAFGISFPFAIERTIANIGNCTTAVSMIMIGSILYEVDFKKVLNPLIFYHVLIRLLLIPGVLLLVLYPFSIHPVLKAVLVIFAGMPSASLTPILAAKYDGDYIFAAQCVFATTLFSMVTIPIFCLLL